MASTTYIRCLVWVLVTIAMATLTVVVRVDAAAVTVLR